MVFLFIFASMNLSSSFTINDLSFFLDGKESPCPSYIFISHLDLCSLCFLDPSLFIEEREESSSSAVDSVDDEIPILFLNAPVEHSKHNKHTLDRSSQVVLKKKRRVGMSREQRQAQDEYHKKCFQLTFNRILKNDIRRDYGVMYCNVMNSLDAELILSFFQRYCVSTCVMTDHIQSSLQKIQPIVIYGPHSIAELLHKVTMVIPDAIGQLKECRIVRKFQEEGSAVVIDFHLSASQIIPMPNNHPAMPADTTALGKIDMLCRTTFHLDLHHQIAGITVEALSPICMSI